MMMDDDVVFVVLVVVVVSNFFFDGPPGIGENEKGTKENERVSRVAKVGRANLKIPSN